MIGLLLVCVVGLQGAWASPLDSSEALRHAITYHHWARATENSMVLHEAARREYEQALGSEDGPTRRAAENGRRQVEARLENAHDTFRNVVWAAWWLSGQDETVETYDEPWMRAIENAWKEIESQTRPKPGTPQVPMVVRRPVVDGVEIRDVDPDFLRDVFQDEVLNHVWRAPGRLSVDDDYGASLVPGLWRSVINDGPDSARALDALAGALDVPSLLVMDVTLADRVPETNTHLAAYRVDLTARRWKQGKGFAEKYTSDGIGADAVHRTPAILGWIGFLVLASVALVGIRHRLESRRSWRDASEASLSRSAVLALIAYVGGLVLGGGAAEVSAGFLQQWSTPSFLLEGDWYVVPYLPALAWPLVHGAVVMVGPIVLLTWATLKLPSEWMERIGDPTTQLSVVAPAAQAGALTWLFSPLVMVVPGRGWQVALPLSLGALACTLSLAPPIARVLRGQQLSGRGIAGATLSALCLLLILPLGLFNDLYWWIGIMAVALALVAHRLGQVQPEAVTPSAKAAVVELQAAGSLEHPAWLDVVGASAHFEALGRGASVVVKGPSSIGVSRLLAEIDRGLEDKKRVHRWVHTPVVSGSGDVVRPFALATEILKVLGVPGANLAEQEARVVQAGSLLGQTEGFLSDLPGLGALFGMLPGDGGDVSRARVIRDGVRACCQRLSEEPSLLLIDDVQWADASSLAMIRELIDAVPPGSLSLALGCCTTGMHAEIADIEEAVKTRGSLKILELPHLTPEQMNRFVGNCGIAALPEEVLGQLHSVSKGCPGVARDLLFAVRSQGLLVSSGEADVGLVPVEGLTGEDLLAAIPTEYLEAERLRLGYLEPEHLLLLECAAACGRRFTVAELAAGMGESAVRVATTLDKLEMVSDPPIVEDVPGAEDIFRFTSGLTWQALRRRLDRGDDGSREILRNFRARAAATLVTSNLVTPDRLLGHALAGGMETRDIAVQAAARVALDAARRTAWPEVLKIASRVEHLVHLGRAEDRLAIRLCNARACRFTGGQDNREKAQRLYRAAMNSALDGVALPEGFTLFSVVMGWCEVQFEEQDGKELLVLEKDCQDTRDDPRLDQSSRLVVRFYALLSRAVRTRKENIADALADLREQAGELPDGRDRDLLISILLQTEANRRQLEEGPPREASSEEKQEAHEALWVRVEPLLDQARDLKEKIRDLQGLAGNDGLRGTHYLYKIRDFVEARRWLEASLGKVEAACIDADLPLVLNKLSLALKGLGNEASGDESLELFREATRHGREAVKLAMRLERENDLVHGVINLGGLLLSGRQDGWLDTDPVAELDDLGAHLASAALWESVTDNYAKGQIPGLIERIRTDIGERPWMSQVLALTGIQE